MKKLILIAALAITTLTLTAQRATLTTVYPFSALTNHLVNLNLAAQFIQATNNVALTQSTNRAAGVLKRTTVIVRTVQDRTFFANASWVWVGNTNAVAPATLSSNKTYVFDITGYGASETNVAISYMVQQ